MTIENAIKILEIAKAEIEWTAPLEYQEAFDMAIDALQNSPTQMSGTSDLIRRQDAIDAINNHLRRTDVPASYPGIVSALTEWLNELPSVQPDSKESSSTHKALDTISRQAAIDALYHVDEYNGRSVEAIRNLPSAQPEPHWISCEERLPGKEGMYIVTDDVGGASGIICDAFFYCDDGKPTWLLSQNAIAWMPLPESYKEGEG